MKNYLILIFIAIVFGNCSKSADSASGSTTVGKGGSMARFTIVGDYLYSVDKQSLSVIDLKNPAQPVLKKNMNIGFEIETIFPFGDRLFIGSTSVIHIFSIANPENPQRLSTAISPTVMRRCDPVVAKDTVAFATLRTNGSCGGTQSILAVFNIKDITKPVQQGSYVLSEPYGLGYSGNTLYICDKYMGLMVFDITNPFTPDLIMRINNGNYIDVIPYGNTLICWSRTGVTLYDITDSKNPVLLSEIG